MQVSNNMNSNPNFGMALRVSKAAKDVLKNTSEKRIQDLEKAGEELADTKFWHLDVADDGSLEIASCWANRYKTPVAFEVPYDEFLGYNTTWIGTDLGGDCTKGAKYHNCIKFENKEQALAAYNKLEDFSNNSDIKRYSDFVKYLDDDAIKKEAKKQAEILQQEKHNKLVDSLLEKFGI